MATHTNERRAHLSDPVPDRWSAAYAAWPTEARLDWSLDEARHRNVRMILADPDVLPAWESRSSRHTDQRPVHDAMAIRAARARALTDPLGAKGFRQTRRRIKRETSARRGLFAASIAAFATCFGLILYAQPEADSASIANGVSVVEGASSDGSLNAFTVIEPTPTPTSSSAVSGSENERAVVTMSTRSATGAEPETAVQEPTATAAATATATATATAEIVQQAPKKHTTSKSS